MKNPTRLDGLRCLLALGLLVGVAVVSGAPQTVPLRPTAAAPNPVLTSRDGVRNATFYYDGSAALKPGSDLSRLGQPSIVVTTPKANGSDAVQAIHSTGAKAYRYVQFYWAPSDTGYEGINLARHPHWAYCASGGTRVLGRRTDGGRRKWYYIDANEKAVRARFKHILAGYKSEGWDGVMFDRGEAATEYAKGIKGKPIWYRKSSCTARPYRAHARFSDAYVHMLGLAHAVGLQAMMNNGKSPFDPVTRMRPNPRNAECRAAHWSRCTYLSDIWSNLNLVLNETATRTKDLQWRRTFVGNGRAERNAQHGRRTLALITTNSLGGAANQTRRKVFYAWSRIKLFNLAVAVNTGDGGCSGGGSGVCNRYGVYPKLVNVLFGKPRGTRPVSQGCVRSSKIHCVWLRRYADGLNLINASGRKRTPARVSLKKSSCRYVYSVYGRRPLVGNRCVTRVTLKMPAWSGRPLKYSTKPW